MAPNFKLPFTDAWRDISNYNNWIQTIKREKRNPNSLFNKYNIDNNYFYNIYLIVTLPEEDYVLPDNIKRLRLVETLAPIHRYIDTELGFAEYIVPEFNQVYDDENKPTLSYVVVYRFAFKKLSVKYIISRIFYLIIFYFLITKIPWIKIFSWISSLI